MKMYSPSGTSARFRPSNNVKLLMSTLCVHALSVSPLTWSHSTFVLTVIECLNKLNEIRVCETCGLPLLRKTRAKLW